MFYVNPQCFPSSLQFAILSAPSGREGQRVLEKFPVNSALCHVHSGCIIVNIYCRYILQIYTADILQIYVNRGQFS